VAKAHRPTAALGPVLGSGPTYPAGLGLTATLELNGAPEVAGYRYVKVLWVIDSSYRGPVLVRGRRIDSDGDIRFGFGADLGAPELQLTVEPWAGTEGLPDGWRLYPSTTGVQAPGCFAYQIDGTSFTTTIVFQASDSTAFR
jgi:hypothetical protein